MFSFEFVFKNILNINYVIKYEEDLLKEKNEIILWEEQLYLKSKTFSINCKEEIITNLQNNNFILIGSSSNWANYKNDIEDIIDNKIYEYENSQTILFERV